MKTKTISGRNTRSDRSPRRTMATAAITPASAPNRTPKKPTNANHWLEWPEAAGANDIKESAANGIKSLTAHEPSGVRGGR